eukprot:Em0017g597a
MKTIFWPWDEELIDALFLQFYDMEPNVKLLILCCRQKSPSALQGVRPIPKRSRLLYATATRPISKRRPLYAAATRPILKRRPQPSVCDSYKADPEKKKASVRDSYNADIESKQSAEKQRYQGDLEENRAAKRQQYQEDVEENRAAKRQKYEDNSAAIDASERNRHWNDPAVRLAKRAAERAHGYHYHPKS